MGLKDKMIFIFHGLVIFIVHIIIYLFTVEYTGYQALPALDISLSANVLSVLNHTLWF